MKERQRWRPEEDAILRGYVRQYGPREWSLVSQRMSVALDRDAKSCLERWKNYLKPGIKKGSLSEEEQRLVIRLQAKHGNKWKRIAAEVPGRTPKRLGKWWEVFKEKQTRDAKRPLPPAAPSPTDQSKYDFLLQNFAEKLVNNKDRRHHIAPLLMATPLLPPWLSNTHNSAGGGNAPPPHRPQSPSITLSLASAAAPWQQQQLMHDNNAAAAGYGGGYNPNGGAMQMVEGQAIAELVECCRELEEGHRAWAAHKKEAAWRLRRVEQQLESKKACKRTEKMEEYEAKMRALREEQQAAMERIEAEYREQITGLRRDAEQKEMKMAEQYVARQARLSKFVEQIGCRRWPPASAVKMNGR